MRSTARPTARRLAVGVLAVIAVLITACTAGEDGDRSGATSPPGPTSPPVPTPSGPVLEPTATARPTADVPSVRPPGMVDPPAGRGMARYTGQTVHWSDCGEDADLQCARVLAPLDYQDLDGPAITLAISRKRSPAADPLGAIFINPGGPGGSGVDYVGYFDGHGVEQQYDIVGWDPRGVGRSTPVRCFDDRQLEQFTAADYSPDTPAETASLARLNTAFGQACLAKSGRLLEHISTEETVRDLELLRQLLDQRMLTYFGSSYGTSIGAMYATLFGEHVGRLVLDGATDIGATPEISQTEGFERSLGNFAGWCAEQHCRLGDSRTEVLQTVHDFLLELDRDPIPGGRRELTQALATSGLLYALYAPADNWPQLERGLSKAIRHRDGSDLLTWADRYNQRDPNGNFGQLNAAFPAIRCLDEGDHGAAAELQEWRRLQRAAPALGQLIGPDLACPAWPVQATGDTSRRITYDGTPPVLILGTTGDPATPYEYARQMHSALRSSRLITLEGNGHLAFDQSSCVQQHVRRFLLENRPPAQDQICHD